jgi:hypothetical protein
VRVRVLAVTLDIFVTVDDAVVVLLTSVVELLLVE